MPAFININEIVPKKNQLVFWYFEIIASPKIHNPDENNIKPIRASRYLFINAIYNNLKTRIFLNLIYYF